MINQKLIDNEFFHFYFLKWHDVWLTMILFLLQVNVETKRNWFLFGNLVSHKIHTS